MLNSVILFTLLAILIDGVQMEMSGRCLSQLSRHMSQIGDKNDLDSLLKISQTSGGVQKVFKCVKQFSRIISSEIVINQDNGSIQFELDCNECSQSRLVNFKTTLSLLDQFRVAVKHFGSVFEFKYKPFGGIQRVTRRMYKLLKRYLSKQDAADLRELVANCEDHMENLLNGLDKFILDQESLRLFADEFTDGYRLPFMTSVLGNLYTTWMSMSILHQACQTITQSLHDNSTLSHSESDRIVGEMIETYFINYALTQLASGDKPASFRRTLPELVNQMYSNQSIYELEHYLLANYRDFDFYIVDNFHITNTSFDYVYDRVDLASESNRFFHSTVETRNECGVFQVKSKARRVFLFVYFRYNPYGDRREYAYSNALRRNMSKIIHESVFVRASRPAEVTSVKLRELSPHEHCWNLVMNVNRLGQGIKSDESIFECRNDNLESRAEFLISRKTLDKDSKLKMNFCVLVQFYDGPKLEFVSSEKKSIIKYSKLVLSSMSTLDQTNTTLLASHDDSIDLPMFEFSDGFITSDCSIKQANFGLYLFIVLFLTYYFQKKY